MNLNLHKHRIKLFNLIFISAFLTNLQATNIRGTVFDKSSNEPLVGATVYLENTNFNAVVNLDGSYEINNVGAGTYKAVCSIIGYTTATQNINITNENILKINFGLDEATRIINEIVISAQGNRESEESARKSEQKSNNVVNILSAKTIQLLPDVTVGNVLQRVSGVSITRNSSGDGQYAIIRGMDKRYNYTTVNGIKIPSPDNKNRYVPNDIFPADLLERLEVTKALTPNMEGDAIGGAMNLQMKSAPDHFIFNAAASTGYSDIFSQAKFSGFSTSKLPLVSPQEIYGKDYASKPADFSINHLLYNDVSLPINTAANLTIGNRFLDNKLGFIVAGSYSRAYRGGNSLYYSVTSTNPDPVANTPNFDNVQYRSYSNLQTRIGTHLKLDYFIDGNNKLSLYNMFVQLEESQHRSITDPTIKAGDQSTSNRSQYQIQNIYTSSLIGEHLFGNFKIDWTAAISHAASNRPDWADWSIVSVIVPDTNKVPTVIGRYAKDVTHRWAHNEDNDKSAYLNFDYKVIKGLNINVGGMYRNKNRNSYFSSYTLTPPYTGNNPQPYESIDKVVFQFIPSSFAVADTSDANNYTTTENITAGYAQLKYTLNKLQIVGGARYEKTDFSYLTALPLTFKGKSGSSNYSDLLPSVHLKYALSEKQNLRLSYFAGISRPSFFDYIPAVIPGDFNDEKGNPFIKHTQSDNVDLRYEFFPNGSEQILAGVFYKSIFNPIEYGFEPYGTNSYYITPVNRGTATNYGFEFLITKYYKNFGITANYTYTKSEITTTKTVYERKSDGSLSLTDNNNQTRPLQGQSDHIANVSLIYKNAKSGWDAQFAWVYTGKRINVVSIYKDLDYWQSPTSQLDFSAEKKFAKHFSIYAKATNLINNPIEVNILKTNPYYNTRYEQLQPDKILIQRDQFGRTFTLGFRYKL